MTPAGASSSRRSAAALEAEAVRALATVLPEGMDPIGTGLIGIGVDVVELDRMATVLGRTPTFATRVFTEGEQTYCRARRDPTERFAARFAAKEATLKAMGAGLWKVPMTAIEVVRDDDTGEPSLRLHGGAADLAAERGITSWRITMTHTDTVALAITVALGPPHS